MQWLKTDLVDALFGFRIVLDQVKKIGHLGTVDIVDTGVVYVQHKIQSRIWELLTDILGI